MKIVVNNKEKIVKDNLTIAELLENEGKKKWALVWVNDEHIFMKHYKDYVLKNNDKVNINDALVYG